MADVELIIRKNGSTLVKGVVVLKDQDGNVITPPNTPFALCRCGASNNKPFCDGSHKRIGFDDTPRAAEKTRSAEESNGDLEAQS
jgi:CDGSH iron-sulfur domain-containing protein 3